MRETRLILVEGLPGSGKSMLAQEIAWQLARSGSAARWWYEEEAGHPVYLFADETGLRQVVADLDAGRAAAVVREALNAWARFVDGALAGGETVVIDGCLFGYLTWTLFPYGVAEEAIAAYVAEVGRIVAPLAPVVINLWQGHVARSLRRVGARRGAVWAERAIARVSGSAWARARGLTGFDGMVAFWTAYRDLTDRLCAALPGPKFAIDIAAEAWDDYRRRALAFLDLPDGAGTTIAADEPARFRGRYVAAGVGGADCTVALEGDALIVDGLPQMWRQTPLLPREDGSFAVASLPLAVRFAAGAAGKMRMFVAGPALLGGAVAGEYRRVDE